MPIRVDPRHPRLKLLLFNSRTSRLINLPHGAILWRLCRNGRILAAGSDTARFFGDGEVLSTIAGVFPKNCAAKSGDRRSGDRPQNDVEIRVHLKQLKDRFRNTPLEGVGGTQGSSQARGAHHRTISAVFAVLRPCDKQPGAQDRRRQSGECGAGQESAGFGVRKGDENSEPRMTLIPADEGGTDKRGTRIDANLR